MKMKKQNIKVLLLAILAVALGIGVAGVNELEAASKLPKTKLSLRKRNKKSAVIKLKGGSVTGYRIYMKSGKKGKWKLQTPVMRGVKGKFKGELATFSLRSDKLTLTKLKPKKVYYIRVKAWKSSWKRPGRIKLSPYSKTLKIGKYEPPVPTGAEVPTGDAVQFPDESPSADPMETPDAEQTEIPGTEPSGL